jgi:Zinc carboxypeptidase
MGRSLFASVSVTVAIALAAVVGPLDAAFAQGTPCDPIQTTPHFRGEVPSPQEILGYPIGSQEATADDIEKYVGAVDAASSRVVSDEFATSWKGRPLVYAIVGRPENVTSDGLARVRGNTALLRNPFTSAEEAGTLAASTPAILWLAGNVHGNEESGADADLRILYELADRDDCAAQQILDNAVVVIAPTRTPMAARPRPAATTTTSTSTGTGSRGRSPRRTGSSTCCASTRRRSSSTLTRWADSTTSSRPTRTRSTTRSPTR